MKSSLVDCEREHKALFNLRELSEHHWNDIDPQPDKSLGDDGLTRNKMYTNNNSSPKSSNLNSKVQSPRASSINHSPRSNRPSPLNEQQSQPIHSKQLSPQIKPNRLPSRIPISRQQYDKQKQKTYTNTIQSVQLPLDPKLNHNKKEFTEKRLKKLGMVGIKDSFVNGSINQGNDLTVMMYSQHQRYLSLSQTRPHTIHNYNSFNMNQQKQKTHIKNQTQALTSLNFYDSTNKRRIYNNTLDYRTRLNEELELFASKIKQQERLLRSIEEEKFIGFNNNSQQRQMMGRRQKIKSQNNYTPIVPKQQTSKINYKTNIANRSFFYKQVKNFLVQSFKVSGKPVSIQKDKYSIETHGLPKKKSIYSFKNRNSQGFSMQLGSKTQHLLLKKKLNDRYDMELPSQQKQIYIGSPTKHKNKNNHAKNHSIIKSQFLNQTVNLRRQAYTQKQSIKHQNDKRRTRGKLYLGRPPSKVVTQDEQLYAK